MGGIESKSSARIGRKEDRRGQSSRFAVCTNITRECSPQTSSSSLPINAEAIREVCHRLFQVRSFIGKYSNHILEALM